MRQRLAKWMMGRNGMDALNRLLSVLTLILLIVSMFVHGYAARILWSLAVVGLTDHLSRLLNLILVFYHTSMRNISKNCKHRTFPRKNCVFPPARGILLKKPRR